MLIWNMKSLFGLIALLCVWLPAHAAEDPCGTTRGCFRSPADCYPASACTFFVAWNRNSGNDSLIDFELSIAAVSGDTYGAVGFSENNKMPDSDVYVCRSDGTLQRYFTGGYSQGQVTTRTNKGLSNITLDVVDGIIRCTFSRIINLDDGDADFPSLNNLLYIIVATSTRTGDTLDYHGESRWLTPKSVNLLATNDVSGGADQLPTTKNTNAADDPCGTTRGCFRSPEDCYPPSSCTFFVAWNRNSDTDSLIDFELSVEAGPGDTFGAVGFSENNKMPSSDVYACFSDGMLQRYFTGGYTPSQVTTRANKGLSNIMVDAVDGTIRCTFSRNIDLDDGDAEFLSLNKLLYIIGSTSTRNGDTLVNHGSNRWVTTSAVDLLAVGDVSGDDQLPKTKKAHGILMVIAWMFFASTGILVTRYMKTFLPEETLCGTKVWFNIHRICMISTWVLFVSAFVAIFAVKGEFVQSTNKTTFAHAIMGCFAVGFGTINPIMAIFRPHPGTPRRPYFNHLHRIVGLSGWVCAITAIVLACDFYFESAESITDVGAFWIMFTFLIIAFTIILTFEIFNFRTKCDTNNEKANQPDGVAMQPVDGNDVAVPTTSGKSCERWRTLIFGCSFLCIFILTVVMISEIAKV